MGLPPCLERRREGRCLWLRPRLENSALSGPVGICRDQAGGAGQALEVCGRSQGPRKPLVSLSICRPGLLPTPRPMPCPPPPPTPPPTWLDSPSSLAGEQEGVGSFQNVSVELLGESWQLEIVSRLLDNQQPNNSGNGVGRRALCRVAKRSSPQPPENSDPPLPASGGGPSGDQNHTS